MVPGPIFNNASPPSTGVAAASPANAAARRSHPAPKETTANAAITTPTGVALMAAAPAAATATQATLKTLIHGACQRLACHSSATTPAMPPARMALRQLPWTVATADTMDGNAMAPAR